VWGIQIAYFFTPGSRCPFLAATTLAFFLSPRGRGGENRGYSQLFSRFDSNRPSNCNKQRSIQKDREDMDEGEPGLRGISQESIDTC